MRYNIDMLIRSRFALIVTLLVLFVGSVPAYAADSFSLTVTPPLFQITIGPGETWSSTIKAVNTNPYDTTLYTTVMEFQATGEEGQGTLVPVTQQDASSTGTTLADWISVSKDPIPAARGNSIDVPFTVTIPRNAAPGGYYAAILIGSQPFDNQPAGSLIRVSSYISSLIFVRIKGDVVEKGAITEFTTDHYFYNHPQVQFTTRFDNTGTVHVQPTGNIEVFSMWGTKMATIPINEKSNFGNVLAHSVRKFSFTWDSQDSLSDFGLYHAVLTLTFGTDEKQNISAQTSFWIVPLKPLAYAGGMILLIMLLILWIVRSSINRALRRYQITPETE